MEKEDESFLNQLVSSLEKGIEKLEESYNKKDYEIFAKSKRHIFEVQKKISEVVR